LIFSGQLLLDLAAAGMLREDDYKVVQGHATRAWESDGDFRWSVENDPEILSYLPLQKLRPAFSLERYLAHVEYIFERVFSC
jgi:adenylosuccinate lyase